MYETSFVRAMQAEKSMINDLPNTVEESWYLLLVLIDNEATDQSSIFSVILSKDQKFPQ